MTIPLLNFQPLDPTNVELEIIELSSLYERVPKLGHNPAKPHRLEFFHLMYIKAGSGSHFIDFKRYPFQSGSFIFVNEHQIHAFDLENCPEGKVILFTQTFLDSTNINIRMPFFSSNMMQLNAPVLTVKNALKNSFESIINEISNEVSNENCDSLIVQFLFSALLLKLNRERPTTYYDIQVTEQQAIKFKEFTKLVESKFTKHREATDYAEMLGMTYKSLNQICKQACNQTPKQLIDAYTILEAKRRLTIEKVQVSQLAYSLGFDEVSNFVKYFKNHTLVTPAQFKSTHSG